MPWRRTGSPVTGDQAVGWVCSGWSAHRVNPAILWVGWFAPAATSRRRCAAADTSSTIAGSAAWGSSSRCGVALYTECTARHGARLASWGRHRGGRRHLVPQSYVRLYDRSRRNGRVSTLGRPLLAPNTIAIAVSVVLPSGRARYSVEQSRTVRAGDTRPGLPALHSQRAAVRTRNRFTRLTHETPLNPRVVWMAVTT